MRYIVLVPLLLAAILITVASSPNTTQEPAPVAQAEPGPTDPAAEPAPRTWADLPTALLEATGTVASEQYAPEPEPASPTDEYGYTPDDPFYRPPGMDPCEENAHGMVDNDACLAQHGYVPPDGW